MVPVDTNGVKVLYGVNPRKGMRLHDFYHTMSNAVVCRDETTDTMGIPFCGSCGQQHSGATLESCGGRCTYCACCPHCATLLLATETEVDIVYACPNCRYSTTGSIAVDKGSTPVEAEELLSQKLLAAESQRDHSTQFSTVRSELLQACQALSEQHRKRGAPPDRKRPPMRRGWDSGSDLPSIQESLVDSFSPASGRQLVSPRPDGGSLMSPADEWSRGLGNASFTSLNQLVSVKQERETREIGERAMGMAQDTLRHYDRFLAKQEDRRNCPDPVPRCFSLTDLLSNASAARAAHVADPPDLPIRHPLLVRSAVRYNKALLVSEMDAEGSRRLNRNASLLFPRVFVASEVPVEVAGGQTVVLALAFVNPGSSACTVASLSCVKAHLCTAALPPISDEDDEDDESGGLGVNLSLSERPETESHTYLFVPGDELPAECGIIDFWDNTARIAISLTLADTLPASPGPGEGPGVTLKVKYRHTTAVEETETTMYIFLVLPLKPSDEAGTCADAALSGS
ncbi:hypothetical protein DIPPA_16331 [Diplonema papillatum]|nr:hypothetical protein DIPPA_16331 [Diplonema papillatum]